jgi:hypothetical protein
MPSVGCLGFADLTIGQIVIFSNGHGRMRPEASAMRTAALCCFNVSKKLADVAAYGRMLQPRPPNARSPGVARACSGHDRG